MADVPTESDGTSLPPPPPPPPPAASTPEPPPPPAPPADEVGEPRGRLRLALAIFIGLTSVVGAYTTWRAFEIGNAAGDADDAAIEQTLLNAASSAQVEVWLRSEESSFARYEGHLAAAQALRELADEAAAQGDVERATTLAADAQVLEEVAAANSYSYLEGYPYGTGEEGKEVLNEKLRRTDLLLDIQRQRDEYGEDPVQTAAEGDSERRRGQRLALAVIVFAVAVVLLTIAEQSTRRKSQAALAFLGGSVVVIGTIMAVVEL